MIKTEIHWLIITKCVSECDNDREREKDNKVSIVDNKMAINLMPWTLSTRALILWAIFKGVYPISVYNCKSKALQVLLSATPLFLSKLAFCPNLSNLTAWKMWPFQPPPQFFLSFFKKKKKIVDFFHIYLVHAGRVFDSMEQKKRRIHCLHICFW